MNFKKHILNNGLRVITVPMQDNPSVTILVMAEAGSKYETKESSGISHYLEHMVFKGTSKRPKASDISRELDSVGANYNAFTSREYTGYYVKADRRHIDLVLDVVSDMYTDPIFDEKEMAKEKGVIIEELRMYKDLPHRHVHDVFNALLYGDQPAGWDVGGTEDTVRSFAREQLISYKTKNYTIDSSAIVVAGAFDESKILDMISRSFSGIDNQKRESKKPVSESQNEPKINLVYKETDQAHMVIGVRTFSIFDPRIPVMEVLVAILSGGMSSRLFSKMRDELGICYYVRANHDALTDHGYLAISAGLDSSRVEEGIKELLLQCKRLAKEMVSDEELKKAKDYISGTTMLDLETSDSRAYHAAYYEALKHHVETPEEMLSKIQKVTATEIRDLARQIFRDESLNMAMISRFKDDSVFRNFFTFGA